MSRINENIVNEIRDIKKKGKKIVLCHGVFDLVHPGHIDYFQAAKSLGDILVVTITSDRYIKKNIHSPYFDEDIRSNFLKKINLIDHVFIIDSFTAVPAIQKIKPNYYCKGVEYKKKDDIGNLSLEKKALTKVNGKLRFLGKNVQSSTKFISENFFKFDDKIIQTNLAKIQTASVKKIIDKAKKLKVLIVGESIIDKYTYVETNGVSPKSNTLSCIKKDEKIMSGGVLATYKFVSSFVKSTFLVSLINQDLSKDKKYQEAIGKSKDLIKSKSYPKIIKNRIIEGQDDKKLRKFLTINDFEEKKISIADENLILKKLNKLLSKVDVVIVQDFGHNLLTNKVVRLLEKKSKKLSICIQANSLNYGFNIIGKKFKKANIYSLDERELQLFAAKKNINHYEEVKNLNKLLSAEKGFLTCGAKFSIVAEKNSYIQVPTLNKNAVDTMGAGDIFHAMASILSCLTKNNFLILFLSQIAGAHSVSIFGNSDFPKVSEILKTFNYYKNLLKK